MSVWPPNWKYVTVSLHIQPQITKQSQAFTISPSILRLSVVSDVFQSIIFIETKAVLCTTFTQEHRLNVCSLYMGVCIYIYVIQRSWFHVTMFKIRLWGRGGLVTAGGLDLSVTG